MRSLLLIFAVAVGFAFNASGQTTGTMPADKTTRANAKSAQFSKGKDADKARSEDNNSIKKDISQVNGGKPAPAGTILKESERIPANANAADKKMPVINGKKYIDESEKAPATVGDKKAPNLNGKGYIDEAK